MNRNNRTIQQLAERMAAYNSDNDISPSDIESAFSKDGNKIPDPADLDKTKRNLIVFDDIMKDRKQTMPENYYTRGRSANCDCVYLSQNCTELPLHTRANSNFMVFFKSSKLVVDQLYRNFSSVDNIM